MEHPPKLRGRPKTLDRDRVLECAVMQYWAHGPAEVSVNNICNLVQASKPGIYREFGSDDGLKAAALKTYQTLAIDPFLALLKTEQPLAKTLEDIVDFLMQDRDALSIPKGCLFVSMRAQRERLGLETLAALDHLRAHFLRSFAEWIDASKQAKQFCRSVPTTVAMHQLDALHAGVMRMQKENVNAEEVEGLLRFGLSAISGESQTLHTHS